MKQLHERIWPTEVQPLLDEDGALLDASMPEYPWLGREITVQTAQCSDSHGFFSKLELMGIVNDGFNHGQ